MVGLWHGGCHWGFFQWQKMQFWLYQTKPGFCSFGGLDWFLAKCVFLREIEPKVFCCVRWLPLISCGRKWCMDDENTLQGLSLLWAFVDCFGKWPRVRLWEKWEDNGLLLCVLWLPVLLFDRKWWGNFASSQARFWFFLKFLTENEKKCQDVFLREWEPRVFCCVFCGCLLGFKMLLG